MYTYSKEGVTVAAILRYKNKEGLFPVKIRVTYHRERDYYSTGKALSKEDWEVLPETKSKRLISIREDIQAAFNKVCFIVKELDDEGIFTFDNLKNRLKRSQGHLEEILEAKIEQMRREERIGTMNTYIEALRSFQKYDKSNPDIFAIDVNWLTKYEKYMLMQDRSYTTIGMHLRNLRTVINEKIRDGVLKPSQSPFGKGKYEIKKSEGRKLALSEEQIKQLVHYSDKRPAIEKYRDLWTFSYLCNGINFADMLRLKYRNIEDNEIRFMRTKTTRTVATKKDIVATLHPKMTEIIERWGNKDKSPDNYIFPCLKGDESAEQAFNIVKNTVRCCNKRLNEIGKAMGIQGLSSYTARHSYATLLKRKGANISFISESLGHSDIKTTENYLASFEREEREKNSKLLLDFVEEI